MSTAVFTVCTNAKAATLQTCPDLTQYRHPDPTANGWRALQGDPAGNWYLQKVTIPDDLGVGSFVNCFYSASTVSSTGNAGSTNEDKITTRTLLLNKAGRFVANKDGNWVKVQSGGLWVWVCMAMNQTNCKFMQINL